MKRLLLGIGAFAALAAVAAPLAPATAQSRQAAQRDWSRTIVATPAGGFRMGNPNAAVKVIEYVSLTCPHCAAFNAGGMPQLVRDYVRPGRVSIELRNFVLNPFDVSAALISRCAAPANYFALTDAILSSQQQWMARAQALTPAQVQELEGLSALQRFSRLASISGLDRLAARHGVTPQRARACLSNQAGLDRILALRSAGTADHQVNGTPTFVVNGRTAANVHDWGALRPLLGPPGR